MADSAVGSLIDALVAALRADEGVKTLVRDKVFDRVPDGVAPPWIYFGPAGTRRVANDCFRGWEVTARIFCIATDFNRDLAWAVAEAIDLALDGTLPQLAGGFTLSAHLAMGGSGDITDPTKPQSIFTDVVAMVFRDDPLKEA